MPTSHPWYDKDFGMMLISAEISDHPFWINNLCIEDLATQPGHCDITTHPEGALGRGLWRAVKVSITLPEIVADYNGAQRLYCSSF